MFTCACINSCNPVRDVAELTGTLEQIACHLGTQASANARPFFEVGFLFFIFLFFKFTVA